MCVGCGFEGLHVSEGVKVEERGRAEMGERVEEGISLLQVSTRG